MHFLALKPPKINPFHFSDELNIGMRALVVCAVFDGDPPFSFSWYKDFTALQENRQVSIKTHEISSMLTISNLEPESNGNYTCKVSNSAGTDEKFDILSMKGEVFVILKFFSPLKNKFFELSLHFCILFLYLEVKLCYMWRKKLLKLQVYWYKIMLYME